MKIDSNGFQKAELAYELLGIEKERAKQRQLKGTLAPNNTKVGKSTSVIAKDANLSTRTFERAKTIIEEAPEEVKTKVRTGQQTINSALQEIKRKKAESKAKDKTNVAGQGKVSRALVCNNCNVCAHRYINIYNVTEQENQILQRPSERHGGTIRLQSLHTL